MVKVFRRESHRVLQSERTTIHGADSMLMVLQLAVAEVNKQVTLNYLSFYNRVPKGAFCGKKFANTNAHRQLIHT